MMEDFFEKIIIKLLVFAFLQVFRDSDHFHLSCPISFTSLYCLVFLQLGLVKINEKGSLRVIWSLPLVWCLTADGLQEFCDIDWLYWRWQVIR